MTKIVQIKTDYRPPPTPIEQEREDLRELAIAALSADQFGQALHFLDDVRKFLLVLSGQATLVDR